MGNTPLEQQIGTPIDNNLIALLVTNQTDKVISKVESDQSQSLLQDTINFRGDTLLHYACAKNNIRLVEFLLKKRPLLVNIKNDAGKLPSELATDPIIKSVCMSRSAQMSSSFF